MKKFLPSLFIFLIIANIFAPLSVGTNKKSSLDLKVRKAEAVGAIDLSTSFSKTDTVITVNTEVKWKDRSIIHTTEKVLVTIYNTQSKQVLINNYELSLKDKEDVDSTFRDEENTLTQVNSHAFSGANPNTDYTVVVAAIQTNRTWGSMAWDSATPGIWRLVSGEIISDPDTYTASVVKPVHTNEAGNQTTTSEGGVVKAVSVAQFMPACGLDEDGVFSWFAKGTITGCFAQLLYYVLFVPTSYLFALAGQFFDWSFSYSVSDGAYRSPFVVEGWGIVRDFCNIFFIFVLLYVAFSTILQIHGFNTKGMIINVVIIGLLMNFSLFAAQVIIDTSNILARVFYNSDAIKITAEGKNGTGVAAVGPNGEVPLSAAIVNKVNPQNLIINGTSKVEVRDDVTGTSGRAGTSSGVGVGAFILITLLAVAVNIVGMIVFLSVGLIFIARVIGLWIAMIFVPLAFFSYTVPAMQGMSMAGWKNWWPETLKLAFLAPVFIFFIYLILKFLETGLSLVNADSKNGTAFVIATVVPFVFIMILLLKAKDIAKDMSGKLGQSITGAVSTIGGLALGGAFLGAAVAGRTVIGRGMAAASRTDGAQKMIKYRQDLKDYNSGKAGAVHPGAKPKLTLREKIGDRLNISQEKVGEVDHARHEIDTIKDKAGLKGVADSNLSAVQEQKMKTVYSKEKRSEAESYVKKNDITYTDKTNNTVTVAGEDGYKTKERANTEAEYRTTNRMAAGQVLNDNDKKNIENDLNIKFNAVLKTATDKKLETDFDHLRTESKEQVNPFSRMVSKSNTASYDARNLSQTKADKRENIFTKAGAGLIAGIAMGVRTGLKTSGINHGSGQGDFLKDLSHTLTEAMKSAKVSVKVEESHGSDGSGDHGGGGGHH